MNLTHTVTSIDLAGVRVEFHVAHDDGASTYRVEHDNEHVTVYLHGTPEQLGEFAEAIAKVAAQRAIAEVEAAMAGGIDNATHPVWDRLTGVERWCFVCREWVVHWPSHAHAERADCWHPSTPAELAQRDRATFRHRMVTP